MDAIARTRALLEKNPECPYLLGRLAFLEGRPRR